jgi:hypothetical protein
LEGSRFEASLRKKLARPHLKNKPDVVMWVCIVRRITVPSKPEQKVRPYLKNKLKQKKS